MKHITLALTLCIAFTGLARAADFTTSDPALTLDELKSVITGSSWSGSYDGADYKEYVDPNGELRGDNSKDGKYLAHWKLREDGLFCFDYGTIGMDPGQDGCVQILKKGDQIAYRRLDGEIEGTATLVLGNPFGL